MKTNIKINAVSGKIIMTKATEKKVRGCDVVACDQLAEAMRKFPNFKIEVVSPKVKAVNNKGLTIGLMEKLIKVMTNGNEEAIKGFEVARETYKGTNFHYSKPKAYFLSKYPDWREWSPQEEESQEQVEEQAAQVGSEAAAVEEVKKKSWLGK